MEQVLLCRLNKLKGFERFKSRTSQITDIPGRRQHGVESNRFLPEQRNAEIKRSGFVNLPIRSELRSIPYN